MAYHELTEHEDSIIATRAIVELTEANLPAVEAHIWHDEVSFLRGEMEGAGGHAAEGFEEVLDLSGLLA